MTTNPFRLARLSRALALRLSRLRESLEELAGQLREAVARAVSDAVGESVRAAIRALLPDATRHTPRYERDYWDYQRPAPGWRDRNEEDPDHWWREEPEPPDDLDDCDDQVQAKPQPAKASRWAQAIGFACRAAVWWLTRQVGHYPMLAAAGIGVVSAVGVYAGAPAAAGAAGLAGAAVGLAALAETIDTGAALVPASAP